MKYIFFKIQFLKHSVNFELRSYKVALQAKYVVVLDRLKIKNLTINRKQSSYNDKQFK